MILTNMRKYHWKGYVIQNHASVRKEATEMGQNHTSIRKGASEMGQNHTSISILSLEMPHKQNHTSENKETNEIK